MDATDERHLRRAIELSVRARGDGDEPFGSLLVGPGDEVLAEDVNAEVTRGDITAHPEIRLARWAAAHLPPETAAHTTRYTSCQPCRMCAEAIDRSGLGRVVFALSTDQLHGLRGGADTAGAQVRYDGPALYEEARIPVTGA